MYDVSPSQKAVYNYCINYYRQNGHYPLLEEVVSNFSDKSRGQIHALVARAISSTGHLLISKSYTREEIAIKRKNEIVRQVKSGISPVMVARMFKVSRQYVHQIVKGATNER